MTELQKFMDACAKLLHADKPLIWETYDDAFQTVVRWFSELNGEATKIDGVPVDTIGTGGFELRKYTDNDFVEYELSRKLVDVTFESNGADNGVFDWTSGSNVFDIGLGIDE